VGEALRCDRADRALLLFLYNTAARVQEAADLRAAHLDLGEHPLVRLHGKGDKWRTCPLWHQTGELLRALLASSGQPPGPDAAVFTSRGQPLTRFGIYKIVRRHDARLDDPRIGRRVSPHTFRHTAAVHLQGRGVASNASLPGRREDGPVRDPGPCSPTAVGGAWRETAGQHGRMRNGLRQTPRCAVSFCNVT
jgi:integrase